MNAEKVTKNIVAHVVLCAIPVILAAIYYKLFMPQMAYAIVGVYMFVVLFIVATKGLLKAVYE